jgi:hypothetical protein
MKRVGIITFHCVYNYGAVIQAYAMQETLIGLGLEAEVINFRPQKLMVEYNMATQVIGKKAKVYRTFFPRRYKTTIQFVKDRYDNFNLFISKYLKETKICYTSSKQLEDNPPDYDAYICGSDQIWNSQYNCYENAYFLSFVKDDYKKIAYAPSFGRDSIENDWDGMLKEYITSFHYLSVREGSGKDLLKQKFNLDSKIVLDPVFLIHKEIWLKLVRDNDYIKKPYIFVYIIGEHKELLKQAGTFSEKHDLPIVMVNIGNLLQQKSILIDYDKSNVAPDQFLSLLAHAEYVFTNSFHGAAISIILNKKFNVAMNSNKTNTRITNILDLSGLSKQILKSTDEIDKNSLDSINYMEVNSKIEAERTKSIQFLKDALGI